MKNSGLKQALQHPLWLSHQLGDRYMMDGQKGWKIAYYPIFQDVKTGKEYAEPRALVEKESVFNGELGIDFREVPLRFLTKENG